MRARGRWITEREEAGGVTPSCHVILKNKAKRCFSWADVVSGSVMDGRESGDCIPQLRVWRLCRPYRSRDGNSKVQVFLRMDA